MKISSLPEGDICDVSFGYNPKMYEYTTLMSDIPKLGDIFLKNLLIEMFLVGFKK